jgi:hypothetical protein
MPNQNQSRRLPPTVVSRDVAALTGLRTIPNYKTSRPEANLEKLQSAYQAAVALEGGGRCGAAGGVEVSQRRVVDEGSGDRAVWLR